jgi:hypothetical protein
MSCAKSNFFSSHLPIIVDKNIIPIPLKTLNLPSSSWNRKISNQLGNMFFKIMERKDIPGISYVVTNFFLAMAFETCCEQHTNVFDNVYQIECITM